MTRDNEMTTDARMRALEEMKQAALAVRLHAYAPYSHFWVGAALLDEQGRCFAGCNVENAAYGSAICAERVALTSAIAAGVKPGTITALAVVGDTDQPITPCGACRQVIAELCLPETPVFLGTIRGHWEQTTAAALLPGAFTGAALNREEHAEPDA